MTKPNFWKFCYFFNRIFDAFVCDEYSDSVHDRKDKSTLQDAAS